MKPMEVEARRRLVRRRSVLVESLQGGPGAAGPGGAPSHGKEGPERASGRLTGREMKELVDIEDALARMRRGQYGLCCTCGNPIGRLRLLAIPEVRDCPACDSSEALPGARPPREAQRRRMP